MASVMVDSIEARLAQIEAITGLAHEAVPSQVPLATGVAVYARVLATRRGEGGREGCISCTSTIILHGGRRGSSSEYDGKCENEKRTCNSSSL